MYTLRSPWPEKLQTGTIFMYIHTDLVHLSSYHRFSEQITDRDQSANS